MLHRKRTKIVATVGPSIRSEERIRQVAEAGVNVFRLNFSHGSHAEHMEAYATIRKVASELGQPLAVLQDLQGPKIRVGRFVGGSALLQVGKPFVLSANEFEGHADAVSVSYKDLPRDVRPGMALLLDDGILRLRVERVEGPDIHTIVEIGGQLSDNKGINIPGADLSIPALTDKDIVDLRFGLEMGVDWVAISFVRTRDDVDSARQELAKHNSQAKLMAKIEKPSAVERFDDILEAVDGIMVARGDLGVEMMPEQVPVAQKRLIEKTLRAGKPVITATQMLESMVARPRPTRAEASDVANAIFDGTDAVMLSAETSTGLYPVEAVTIMTRIAETVENSPEYAERLQVLRPEPRRNVPDAIAVAVHDVATAIHARAVIVYTTSGATAWRLARMRPLVPILALTPRISVRNQMNLLWGVHPVVVPPPTSTDEMVAVAKRMVQEEGMAVSGDEVVIAAGIPSAQPNVTSLVRVEAVRNMLRVETIR